MEPMGLAAVGRFPEEPSQDPMQTAWEDVVLKRRPPRVPVRDVVLRSWYRCLELGLDPLTNPSPPILTRGALSRVQSEFRDLIQLAKPLMRMIEISVRGTGFIVTLASRGGYVLTVQGDKDVLAMAERNYYLPGCNRSTEKAGTNSIGVCMEIKQPVQLTGAEHFNVNHHPWTCSSSPIMDGSGEVLGVLTLSGRSVGRHQHTLALVTAAAKTLESQLRERDLIEATQRLNSMLTSIYRALPDGYIALDIQQKITHLNVAAARMLNRDIDAMVGMPFQEVALVDQRLKEAIEAGRRFEASELAFRCPGEIRTYMCRVDPIRSSSYKLLGTVITLSEHRQMLHIAKRIGGNYAKYEFSDIKGRDPRFLKQIEIARLAAKTNSRILIMGESGTGKELFAQAIHNHSNRRNGPFVAVSCAAIPRDLIESELFGYKGGAFTGARRNGMVGKFELADQGTLFLDEIDGLPLELQGKLLRVLQQNEIMRLGDTRNIPIDVRVIAATNADLMSEVDAGNFREDLYYRLNVMEIVIPPLRERIDDLEILVDHILGRLRNRMGVHEALISTQALQFLKTYSWPGNVRELENVIERAMLLSRGHTVRKEHIRLRERERAGGFRAQAVTLEQGYREMIQAALDRSDGNVSRAARELGIGRSTLYRKLEEYGITR